MSSLNSNGENERKIKKICLGKQNILLIILLKL
jgi:hypothetical protein